jgi:hypothetical protein
LLGFIPKKRRRYSPRRDLNPSHKTLLLYSSAEIGPRGGPWAHGDDVRTAKSSRGAGGGNLSQPPGEPEGGAGRTYPPVPVRGEMRDFEPDPRGIQARGSMIYSPVPVRGETRKLEPDPRGRAGGAGRLIPSSAVAPRRGDLSRTPRPSGVGLRGTQTLGRVVARDGAWPCQNRPAS